MARLNWTAIGERFYETGVDRGVLYVGNNPGVAWTGLTSVSESPTGGEAKAYYFDGVKYLNISSSEEFEATINAFASPPEFAQCEGVVSVAFGLFVAQQSRKSFGFSYRTKIGNDLDGLDHAYKIHLVYNALAAPSSQDNTTIGESTEPIGKSWAITTLPPSITGYKPTAHFVIDSRKTPPNLLSTLEDILYGSESAAPRLPSAQELLDLFTGLPPVLRRNLATDPRATAYYTSSDTLGWGQFRWFGPNGQTGVYSLVTGAVDGPLGITTYARKTWSAPTVATDTGDTGFDSGRIPVTPGEDVVVSAMLRPSVQQKGRIVFYILDAANVELSRLNGPEVVLPPNVWTPVSWVQEAPANAAKMRAVIDISPNGTLWTAGSTLDGTALLIEKNDEVLSYFDGSFLDTNEMFYQWEGILDNSTSVLRSWYY